MTTSTGSDRQVAKRHYWELLGFVVVQTVYAGESGIVLETLLPDGSLKPFGDWAWLDHEGSMITEQEARELHASRGKGAKWLDGTALN